MSRPGQKAISAETRKLVAGLELLMKQFPETKNCSPDELLQLDRLTEARQLLNKVAASAAEGGGRK